MKLSAWFTDRLRLVAVLSQVRVCDECCPACRARAAEALGEPVAHCPHCGGAVLSELGGCPCMILARQGDLDKARRRAALEGRPLEEVMAEYGMDIVVRPI